MFKLTPPGNGNTGWTESLTHSFTTSQHGVSPVAALIVDSQNNLYGTTQYGGPGQHLDKGPGTVFKLGLPHQDGTHRTLTVVSSFNNGISSNHPDGAVILYQGALYGTTVYGDINHGPNSCINATNSEIGCSSVFKVTLAPGASKSPTPGGGDPSDGDGYGDDGGTGDPSGGTGQSGHDQARRLRCDQKGGPGAERGGRQGR